MSISTDLKRAANEVEKLERRISGIEMCARWVVEEAERINEPLNHKSNKHSLIKQLKEALDRC